MPKRSSGAFVAAIVVMGVSGSGKTTVGTRLAAALGWRYADADDFHPAANLAKMRDHVPLTDVDRAPWLSAIGSWIDDQAKALAPAVIACSALKHRYRSALRRGRPQVRFVYLAAPPELLATRLDGRRGHFFPADLLESQLRDLEPPTLAEAVLTVEAVGTPDDIVINICAGLHLPG